MLILGLGSNHALALDFLRRALRELKSVDGLCLKAVSGIYQSDAMLPDGAPASWNQPFLNLALSCELRPSASSERGDPRFWLRRFKQIEKKLGRVERERWAPREIDIDILTWDDKVLKTEELSLPHAGILDRPFALLPLLELVEGHWRYPDRLKQNLFEQKKLAWRVEAARPYATQRTLLTLAQSVAVLNLSPDSFSEAGRDVSTGALKAQIETLIADGATVLDVGAESTRPQATFVSEDEEWRRINAALELIFQMKAAHPQVKWSLDCRRPAVLTRAWASFPWDWLNDVGGFSNAQMRELAQKSSADCVVMHSLSVPPRADLTLASGEDPVDLLLEWGRERLAQVGVGRERIILDPGIGFGKTPAQNLEILKGVRRLHELGCALLVGHSRKSFMAGLTQQKPQDRDLESALISAELVSQGVEFLRVHNVGFQARAFRCTAALRKIQYASP